jgi:hypothetical protein
MAANPVYANLLVPFSTCKSTALFGAVNCPIDSWNLTEREFGQKTILAVLPLVVSISFLLIADIGYPRGGVIRVQPQNLVSFARSLQTN